MLRKMNDMLKRELERRKSFSIPAEAASTVPKDLRQVILRASTIFILMDHNNLHL
jgi:hypothetical protein